MPGVAMIGAGTMGTAIGARLLGEGCALAFYDPAENSGGELAKLGGKRTSSPAEAASGAEFVITSLNSADIVERALFGMGGVTESGSAEKLLIDMSSIDPGRTAQFARRLREQCGMGWVDAPLSGGAPAAREGRMTLMLGGSEADVVRAEYILTLLSARRTHLGPAGAGQTVKLVNQILCAGNFLIVAEAVKFAEANGIDASRIPEALAGGRADSAILQEFMGKMARRDYSPTGRIDNMLKDLETVQASSFATRTPMPLTGLVAELHRMLVAGGLGPADSAEYMKLFDLGRDGGRGCSVVRAIVVMGPSGNGKSTLAEALAERLGWAFIEGDSHHPPRNIAKMARGEPLTDEDREPFLDSIGRALAGVDGGVAACSALKKSYRERLERVAGKPILFILPRISRAELRRRMEGRAGHFMPPSLLDSQLAAFEPPREEECWLEVDGEVPASRVVDRIARQVSCMEQDRKV